MEGGRSDLARAAGEASAPDLDLEASAADPDLEASAAAGKGKKSRASSQVLILASDDGRQAQIQGTHTFGERSSGRIVGGQEQEREEIEGLDWDDDKLAKEIDGCHRRLKDAPLLDEYASDDESLLLDEEELGALNRRLALCRIRAHDQEEKYKDMDDESLSELFPPSDLEANEYYKRYEHGFEWHFDRVYCWYAHFQDYQRLMLRNHGDCEYEDWEHYRKICSTLEGDQEFVRFWEEISRKTELIEWYMTRTTSEPRIGRLFYYHVVKVAAGYPNVYKDLVDLGFLEFRLGWQIFYVWSLPYADLLLEMWRLLAREKMSFEDALRRAYNNDGNRYPFIFAYADLERNHLRPLEELLKPILDRAVQKADEADAKGLIMDFVKGDERKPKIYYDYAKKKLGIAKKIGLIP